MASITVLPARVACLMNTLLLLTLCLPVSVELPDGSLVLLRDSNPLVKKITQSPWTHIGIVFSKNGEQWVYEATPGGVRRVSYANFVVDAYSRRLCYNKSPSMYTMKPGTPFTTAEASAMQRFAEGQVGRRYSVKGIFRDRPVEGTNCAQFVAATLQQSGRIRFPNTFSQTPASVLDRSSTLYGKSSYVAAPAGIETQTWIDATDRTTSDTRRWLKWSTWEAFRFWRD